MTEQNPTAIPRNIPSKRPTPGPFEVGQHVRSWLSGCTGIVLGNLPSENGRPMTSVQFMYDGEHEVYTEYLEAHTPAPAPTRKPKADPASRVEWSQRFSAWAEATGTPANDFMQIATAQKKWQRTLTRTEIAALRRAFAPAVAAHTDAFTYGQLQAIARGTSPAL